MLEDALDRAYDKAGWDYDSTSADGLPPPTLRSLLDAFETVFESEGYVGEARNVAAAMRVRLKNLLRGSKGRVLDTVESTAFDELMERPVVIELNEVADDDEKAILAALILDRIQAAAKQRGSTGGQLKHVTVIEEAHRLLAKAQLGARDSVTGDSTRAQAVQAFCEAIAELRAQGEGWVISSQRPATLADDAVANTGTRILHRLETDPDRRALLDDLDASPLDREAAARLRQGEAVMRWPERDEPEVVHIRPATGVDSGRKVSDETVKAHMADHAAGVRRLLPYSLCTRDVCQHGCDPAVRRDGELIAKDLGKEARDLWKKHDGGIDALPPIARLLAIEADRNVQLAYCGAVHLSVAGDALKRKRSKDIRAQIADAIRQAVKQ